ncbi:MAG: hypothetical protein Q9187_007252, partial [Circinaria calcarea]
AGIAASFKTAQLSRPAIDVTCRILPTRSNNKLQHISTTRSNSSAEVTLREANALDVEYGSDMDVRGSRPAEKGGLGGRNGSEGAKEVGEKDVHDAHGFVEPHELRVRNP